MNILYITNKPIYPIIDGGCFAMESFLKSLISCDYDLKNLTLSTHKHPFNINSFPEEIIKKIKPETSFINTKFSIFGLFNSLIKKSSYNVDRFFSIEFREKILSSIQSNTNVVILESIYLLVYLKDIRKHFNGKIFVRTHNVEHIIWDEYVLSSNSFLKKKIYNYLKHELNKFELTYLNKVDGIISISNTDTIIFKELGVTTPIETLSVGIDTFTNHNFICSFKSNHFFFLGAYNWKPNRDAAECLIHEIFPQIQKNIPNAELHFAGSFMPDYFKKYESSSIHFHGTIKDVNLFLLQSGTLIAPISSGSGIRIKILECLALGVPVIASKTALKGLELSPAYCVDSIKDYITFAESIHSNTALIEEYKTAAYNYIQQFHSKKNIVNKLKLILSGK